MTLDRTALQRLASLAPAITWMALIFALSSQREIPSPTGLLIDIQAVIAHLVLFGTLTLLLVVAFGHLHGRVRHFDRMVVVFVTLYGISDEIHQSFVPGRTAGLFDVIVDGLAAVLAIVVVPLARLVAEAPMIARFWQQLSPDRRWLLVAPALVAVYYLSLMPILLDRLDPLTGDEPFYVMTAISLVRDGDLNEANNYAQRDYDEFYPQNPLPADWNGWPAFPRTLPPHPATTDLAGLHTKHGIGLSLLIALPYEFGGRLGAVMVIMLCAVLLAGQTYLLGRSTGASPDIAGTVAVGLAVVMPIAPYALLIFPEVPAALLLMYAIRRLAASSNAVWQWALAGGAIGFLPWLHQRFAVTAAVLAAVLLYRAIRGRNGRNAVPGVGLAALGGCLLIAYNFWLYGSPLQNTGDHAGFNGPLGVLNGTFGLLLDAQWGLLVVAPLFLVALAALPCWWRADRSIVLLTAAAVLPYLAVVAAYRVWWGEWGPAARYLVPIVPLAAGPLCALLARRRMATRVVCAVLWGVGLVITTVGFADPQRFYHQPNGVNRLTSLVDERLGTGITPHLVAFQPYAIAPRNERIGASLLLLAAFGVVVLTMYLWPAIRSTRSARSTLR